MSVAARHVVLRLWRDALLAALALSALGLGVLRALAPPGRDLDWGTALERLVRVLPSVALLAAAATTLASFERERSLLALAAAGRSLRRVGLWLFLAGLPFAGLGLAAELWPRAAPEGPRDERLLLLEDGALLLRGAGAQEGVLVSGADEPTVAWGRLSEGPTGRRLALAKEWRAREVAVLLHAPPLERALPPGLAPLGERSIGELSLAELERRLALQPRHAGLRFARDAKLRDALRPLVLLLIALGAWLRPFGRPFAQRLCLGLLAAFLYLALELWLGTVAAVGGVGPAVGAFAAAALTAGLGLTGWLRADRPAG